MYKITALLAIGGLIGTSNILATDLIHEPIATVYWELPFSNSNRASTPSLSFSISPGEFQKRLDTNQAITLQRPSALMELRLDENGLSRLQFTGQDFVYSKPLDLR